MSLTSKYLLSAGLILSLNGGYAQQTIQFSQYVFNGLAVNPAYAGYKGDWTANLSYRMQWTGIDGAPETGTISFDGLTNSTNKNSGVGIIATTDRIGPQNTSSVYANYAYRIRLDGDDTKRLSFGMAVGAVQYNLDVSKFSATNIGDGSIPASDQSQINPDVRAGLYYYSSGFYMGASVLNLLSATSFSDSYTVIKQSPHAYFTAGFLIPVTHYLDLKPSFMLKEDFKGPTNIDISSYLLINKVVWIGASYRTGAKSLKANLQNGLGKSDAIAAILEVYCNDHFRAGYSYDFTTSKLADYQSGSHEISLSFSIRGKKPRILSPRYF